MHARLRKFWQMFRTKNKKILQAQHRKVWFHATATARQHTRGVVSVPERAEPNRTHAPIPALRSSLQ